MYALTNIYVSDLPRVDGVYIFERHSARQLVSLLDNEPQQNVTRSPVAVQYLSPIPPGSGTKTEKSLLFALFG